VANLTMAVWRQGGAVFPSRITATRTAALLAGVPNHSQSWWWFWYIVQLSLEARSNAYLWKTLTTTGAVTELTALHPDQVMPTPDSERGGLRYHVFFRPEWPRPSDVQGSGALTVGPESVLHIRGAGGMGELVPRTPIDRFRTALGVALAKQDYEANLYANGVMGGLAVSFPAAVTSKQAKAWREIFDAEHAGTFHAGRTKVIGGGASMTQIGMTQRDAQFVEAGALTLRDVWHMTGVPDWVLGIEGKGETAAISKPEHEDARWAHYGLEARLKRIEGALFADPALFAPGGRDYPAFDTAEVIHPDSETADKIAHQQIQDGRLLADEWRVPRGLPPLPGGVGMIPLVTPVGAAPNPST
ncbi:MAG TPA: phage portal protein, partial [Desulfobacterales bacterium]|nr:phage portal protein [Desulfobacterales bacterium]